HDMFDANKNMFDGSVVHARHILLTPPPNDAQKAQQAKGNLLAWKKQLEDQAAAEAAKLPAGTDNLAREKARVKALEDTFAELAKKEAACPSKAQGGELGRVPRAGRMVAPLADA